MRKFCNLDLRRFKVIQGQRSWCQSIAHGWFPVRLQPSSYLSSVSKYATSNFDDLEPTQFKVIQGQSSQCPSKAHWWVSSLTSIVSYIVSLTAFEIFDVQVLWPRSRTAQGHPRSKVMVPTDSPAVVSYLTSADPVVVRICHRFRDIWH